MTATALILIYNHRFEKNLSRLRAIYGGRFRHVVHLMPFSDSPDADVISVSDCSYQFQGYIAQAASRLRELDVENFVFCGDDLLLEPSINETNIRERFELSPGEAFIKQWIPHEKASLWWWNFWDTMEPFEAERGTEWRAQLPGTATAASMMARHGYRGGAVSWRHFRRGEQFGMSKRSALKGLFKLGLNSGSIVPPYPVAVGYSDIVIVPSSIIDEFSRVCGILAAMRVHAEVAIPTALGLTCEKLKTEQSSSVRGVEWWEDQIAEMERRHGGQLYNIELMMKNNGLSWVHPIKLSRWN